MTTTAEKMRNRIQEALNPVFLDIRNDSDLHAEHLGHAGGGETHFTVTVISDQFYGKSRIERHQMIYGLLKEELAGNLHALSLRLSLPGESKK